MRNITDYTGKITSEHWDKPKYMATIEVAVQPICDVISVANSLPDEFDLDLAVGAQLDDVGLWIGIGRMISTPLSGIYFSLDTEGLGFDQGSWKGPFDPDSGITTLDDETYRTLLRAKIGANHWDGTLAGSKAILDQIFSGDTHVFVQDNQDMSITVGVAGTPPSAVDLALLTGGHLGLKPEGVRVNYYIVTTIDGPIFGFDMDNEYVSGFDQGSWGDVYQ